MIHGSPSPEATKAALKHLQTSLSQCRSNINTALGTLDLALEPSAPLDRDLKVTLWDLLIRSLKEQGGSGLILDVAGIRMLEIVLPIPSTSRTVLDPVDALKLALMEVASRSPR